VSDGKLQKVIPGRLGHVIWFLSRHYRALLTEKRPRELENWLPLETFISMPSQAQVACASYFYGWSLAKAPNFRQALLNLDFTRAAKESSLAGAAAAKNKGHERLFLNAASIWDAVANGWEGDLFQVLPQKVTPPEIMIYSAQTISR
jgi:hypothetical protein